MLVLFMCSFYCSDVFLSLVAFMPWFLCVFFFFNVTATTEIYTYLHTLSLHDALPILCDYNFMMMKYLDGEAAIALNGIHGCENRRSYRRPVRTLRQVEGAAHLVRDRARVDRKSTRLNSSH